MRQREMLQALTRATAMVACINAASRESLSEDCRLIVPCKIHQAHHEDHDDAGSLVEAAKEALVCYRMQSSCRDDDVTSPLPSINVCKKTQIGLNCAKGQSSCWPSADCADATQPAVYPEALAEAQPSQEALSATNIMGQLTPPSTFNQGPSTGQLVTCTTYSADAHQLPVPLTHDLVQYTLLRSAYHVLSHHASWKAPHTQYGTSTVPDLAACCHCAILQMPARSIFFR